LDSGNIFLYDTVDGKQKRVGYAEPKLNTCVSYVDSVNAQLSNNYPYPVSKITERINRHLAQVSLTRANRIMVYRALDYKLRPFSMALFTYVLRHTMENDPLTDITVNSLNHQVSLTKALVDFYQVKVQSNNRGDSLHLLFKRELSDYISDMPTKKVFYSFAECRTNTINYALMAHCLMIALSRRYSKGAIREVILEAARAA